MLLRNRRDVRPHGRALNLFALPTQPHFERCQHEARVGQRFTCLLAKVAQLSRALLREKADKAKFFGAAGLCSRRLRLVRCTEHPLGDTAKHLAENGPSLVRVAHNATMYPLPSNGCHFDAGAASVRDPNRHLDYGARAVADTPK
jgi:hypothetical protein